MSKYKEYENARPIATLPLCNWGGLAILAYRPGATDTMVSAWDLGSGYENIRETRVHTTPGGRDYLIRRGRRYYLDQFMRI